MECTNFAIYVLCCTCCTCCTCNIHVVICCLEDVPICLISPRSEGIYFYSRLTLPRCQFFCFMCRQDVAPSRQVFFLINHKRYFRQSYLKCLPYARCRDPVPLFLSFTQFGFCMSRWVHCKSNKPNGTSFVNLITGIPISSCQ